MNKSMAIGTVLMLALGAVAYHAVTTGMVGAAARPSAVAKPMSPLQMMRRDRDAAEQSSQSRF